MRGRKIFGISFLLVAGSALAQSGSVTFFSKSGDWTVNKQEDGGEQCYAFTHPLQSAPSTLDHGNTVLLVQFMDSDIGTGVFQAGYPLEENSEVSLTIGAETFRMPVSESGAFVFEDDDERLMAALMRGRVAEARAVSGRGNETSYSFSLVGLTDALAKIPLCNATTYADILSVTEGIEVRAANLVQETTTGLLPVRLTPA